MATKGKTTQPGAQLFRQGGSGFTAFKWDGKIIAYAQSISHQSPQPVAAPVPIQPLDQRYPMQILVPAAVGPGTLQVQLFELYNSKIWDRLMTITDQNHKQAISTNRLTTYNDLVEVFVRLANIGKGISAQRIVYPPNKVQKNRTQFYADTFHNCMITDIRDDENIDIGTMEVIKNMTIMYTNVTRTRAHAR